MNIHLLLKQQKILKWHDQLKRLEGVSAPDGDRGT
jgi:hypothetical protein